MGDKKSDEVRGYRIGGVILIGIGLLFLAVQMGWIPYLQHTWPLILIIIGVALLIGSIRVRRPRNENEES